MSPPRIFIAGFYEDARFYFQRVQIRERPQQLEMVLCSEAHHVKGHRLRRRDRVVILRGAAADVVYELNLLEILLAIAEGNLAAARGELGELRWWQFRERRRLRERIEKIEQEVGP